MTAEAAGAASTRPARRRRPARIWLAANHGAIGGGEVMLLQTARALRELGHDVAIVAPSEPGDLVDAARADGFATTALPARDRAGWMRALRRWDATARRGVLWCHGLVPAAATAGHLDRIVHLHQEPRGRAQRALAAAAKVGARAVLVPSEWMA
ncbi:MAG: glycosyltransferase, partial [Microbacteriaceae bacterium]|nr:glycosyltransferase [Microbacteriaceae bacterium]